jgi:Lrp/AsnC family transcriptional regulator, regulator for asnA, asnC and gidA
MSGVSNEAVPGPDLADGGRPSGPAAGNGAGGGGDRPAENAAGENRVTAQAEGDEQRGQSAVRSRRKAAPALDSLSKAIIEQLQRDGRMAYATIGKAVGLSEAAVRQRVQRLQETGVIQIVAVTDPLTVGFNREAMIGVRCEGDIEPVAEALSAMPEVTYVVATAGSFDLVAEVVAEDDDQLLAIINKGIRAIPQVRSTESFVYLKLHKQTYTWGTR